MKNILILGANGRIARLVEQRLLTETDAHLTLVLRNAKCLPVISATRETIIEGDVSDSQLLARVMVKQDVVYANLAGNMAVLAQRIVDVMTKNEIKPLIWVTGSGLYHETPEPFGSWVEAMVGHAAKEDTRRAAAVIEASKLNYMIIRAAYMTDDPKIDYELTQKGEQFRGTIISRASIADLILKIIADPQKYRRTSLGISQPGSDDKLAQLMAENS
ncbi:NAD(P)H-binding protein [Lactiplantibacillus mudanjiangensis]|uniref:Short-chain dehydrogenase [Lactobacillus paraplantarum] n=1 Tax=Lactiplantibacillus mudanjiangensis TaxID=1296538 RepID=A0A660E462_9LACO|nr:NAD(P)H-binding protein [Lactiplantibacillus mudanjiangensis]VDG20422.1 short-chain dehydrogenase [Lactobacillus paraplantarum] [Lactiplantibacillus mudanjiangensis]VDG25215.1 short-chain dehydrogenase [Lactobacillus paraplantarum] [Lactiplantibacillus mudanjiangensis]VDG30390.1 short-chain dehydrogenase [Lactobacillus paraplantarum] [Lactiplantibacillus mudanjiangensis]VDG30827.1 short-chain dehydrogenase [Lactobacillus paraplantarum] [Lactiplantibacillus mudanjiangensis]